MIQYIFRFVTSSVKYIIAFFQQSKIFRMHELLYVYNKCLSGIGAIYFWYSTYLKIYSQFFNLQIHRLIIQPSLCMLLYIFLMRFRNKWTDARLSCKNLPSNEYTSFCTILKIFFSPIATDLQLRQEVHMKIWLCILKIFFK